MTTALSSIAPRLPNFSVYLKLVDGVTGKNPFEHHASAQILECTISLMPGMHEVAEIKARYFLPQIVQRYGRSTFYKSRPVPLIPNNRPVKLLWGRRTHITETPLYVTASRITSEKVDNKHLNTVLVTYTLVGASAKMQTQKTRSWKNVSYSYLARLIAAQNGMSCVVDAHPKVFSYVIQNKESDFRFLDRIAKEIGYQFFMRGTAIYFIAPSHVLANPQTAVPQYVMNKTAGFKDTLYTFSSNADGVEPDPVKSSRVVSGLNPVTKAVIESRDQYLSFTAFSGEDHKKVLIDSDRTIESFGEGQQYARYAAAISNKWVTADITAEGHPYVIPGNVVDIEGKAMIDNSAGFWYVNAATHIFQQDWSNLIFSKYFTEAEISRDQVSNANFTPTAPWLNAQKTAVGAKLNGGKWVAQTLDTQAP